MRGLFVAAATAVLTAAIMTAACSNNQEVSRAMPTAPTSSLPDMDPGAEVSRPTVVAFPSRSDSLDFRMQLENKYATGLGRPKQQVFVDMEGEVVWIQEYDRYRVNGCDHTTATQYVLTQVDGAAAAPVCSVRFFPETAQYPPRDEVVDFRRQLGAKYQSMGRRAESSVDADGAATWTSEYLRYRTSGCDHATATQRAMTQIDGNPPPETCLVACVYHVSPQQAIVPSTGGTFTAQVYRHSGACDYVALSESPWITLARPISGSGQGLQTYNVASNTGGPRTGWIRFQWPTGVTYVEVQQGTFNVSFQLFDPATSPAPTTECHLKTRSTTCTLTASAQNLSTPITSYSWKIQYAYGGASKVIQHSSASPSFSFVESCSTSDPAGSPIPLTVTLTATDSSGNISTATTGQGSQPSLLLRSFNCP